MARKTTMARPAGRAKTATPGKTAVATARVRPPEEELVANFFLGVLLFALAVMVFWPVFSAGFIWDDDQLLTANPQVHAPNGWWTLWIKPETADYFPLTSSTLWLEWRMWGMDAGKYHVTNVLMHAVTVVLTWQTLKRLKVPGAWLAAAIFAVHPVCVESVAWISERKNTISQIFFLLAIINYVRFEEKGKVWRYVTAVACFLLSLTAKTSVVMLPFILWVLAWWRQRELIPLRTNYELKNNPMERGILLWSFAAGGLAMGALGFLKSPTLGAAGMMVGGGCGFIAGYYLRQLKVWDRFAGFEAIWAMPFLVEAFALGVVTIFFQYGKAVGDEEIPMGNLLQRAISACFAAGFYLYSAMWPFNLIEIYPQWHRSFWQLITHPTPHWEGPDRQAIPYYLQIIPGLIIAGVLFWCWKKREEKWARALLTGLGCYLLGLLPALGLLKMSYMRLTLVADHFQYISIVAVIALVVAAGNLRMMRVHWLVLAAAFFGTATYLNWTLTADNRLGEGLWIGGALALAGASLAVANTWKLVWASFIWCVLVLFFFLSRGQADIYHSEHTLWQATLDKNPLSWQAHNHLGASLYMEGNWRAAGPHFLRATQLKPENPESHNNLGLYYSMLKDMPDAIREYETAVGIKDDSAMRTNLANAYENVGRMTDAVREYRHALITNPANASAHCNLGYALMQLGRVSEAIDEFMKCIQLDPTMPQGRQDLLQALQGLGIDVNAPSSTGTFPFDVNKALKLLHSGPMPSAQPPQQ